MSHRKDVNLEGGGAPVILAAQWVDEFSQWMVKHRGVGTKTLGNYCRVIKGLLTALGSDPARYTPQSLRQFVADRARPYSRVYAKEVATSTRMFVRYLAFVGTCPAGLEEAIPRIACSTPKPQSASGITRSYCCWPDLDCGPERSLPFASRTSIGKRPRCGWRENPADKSFYRCSRRLGMRSSPTWSEDVLS